MKVTFPAMGNTRIAIKALLEGLRLEVIPPPPITKKTIELGVKYSPEFACMPLKINVGNFIEAIEKGADTIVMAGGWGPCRFGYYAQVEREILKDLGYDFKMVILEAPDFKLSELFTQIRDLAENVSFLEALKAVKFAWDKLKAVEVMEKDLEYYLPRVKEKDKAESIYDYALESIDKAYSKKKIDNILAEARNAFCNLDFHGENILKIGLLGEIYTILEPAANYDIVRHLGRLNAEVCRAVYTSSWINDHLLGGILGKSNHKHIVQCAHAYLGSWVGGHGQETVGCAVDFARRGYDGIIQIGPLTCMPEIVAQSVLNRVKGEENIPCITLYFDEHAGTAGISTRLEAFVDMLGRKKEREGTKVPVEIFG
ncbi:CoA protein activase [Thermosyntropha sp.]|uniref:CoA protein activase n=1 Tax=Thermosyntropha sp. TaxID=2740820 RepID=UPI002600A25B|nr:CoA protein activase [Thermosyntropha sp.]MBO8158682.1 CoA protein activase [Thermosyntropha sp.]